MWAHFPLKILHVMTLLRGIHSIEELNVILIQFKINPLPIINFHFYYSCNRISRGSEVLEFPDAKEIIIW